MQRPNARASRSKVNRCRDGAGYARTSSRPWYARSTRLATSDPMVDIMGREDIVDPDGVLDLDPYLRAAEGTIAPLEPQPTGRPTNHYSSRTPHRWWQDCDEALWVSMLKDYDEKWGMSLAGEYDSLGSVGCSPLTACHIRGGALVDLKLRVARRYSSTARHQMGSARRSRSCSVSVPMPRARIGTRSLLPW